jgi:hypothetical protein
MHIHDDYWDEDGGHHVHDPVQTIRHFVCSLGHRFEEKEKKQECMACGKWWLKEKKNGRT